MELKKEKFIASLLGGAIGDALGYVVEFLQLEDIKSKFGKNGITDLVINIQKGKALISDDTQMTLFTADGLMWAYHRTSQRGIGSYAGSGTYQSYLRWYYTQTKKMPTKNEMIWLTKQSHEEKTSILDYHDLFSNRAPGNTCLEALRSGEMGTIEQPLNYSKGCGGVMRVAPVGLFLHKEPQYAFKIGAELATITHGHPTGYLSAGVFAMIIAEIINGKTILESVKTAIGVLKTYSNHEETISALELAIDLSNKDLKPEIAISYLGEGWIAEEALAISIYCALIESDFKKSLAISVNHSGDSDSTGSICGNILGAYYGLDVIPLEWIEQIELKELIMNMGNRLYNMLNT
ncbi:putative ADP-ribosylglycohydrolase [Heyndrickxia sporothermodurans]|nr:putative ADP-ribosylglycohydrolase [Heyndrickxia sporothermodurans]